MLSDRDRAVLTEIFEALYREINRDDIEADVIRLIDRELNEASNRARGKLQLIHLNKN
jgi:hypothetical protein